MRKWVVWCIEHRLAWAVYTALVLCIPVYVAAGSWTGARELIGEWRHEFGLVRKRAQAQEGQRD